MLSVQGSFKQVRTFFIQLLLAIRNSIQGIHVN